MCAARMQVVAFVLLLRFLESGRLGYDRETSGKIDKKYKEIQFACLAFFPLLRRTENEGSREQTRRHSINLLMERAVSEVAAMGSALTSSLSPPVQQLLVAPVRHLLGAGDRTEEGDVVVEQAAAKAQGWVNSDGSFDWAMLDAYVPTPEETQAHSPLALVKGFGFVTATSIIIIYCKMGCRGTRKWWGACVPFSTKS
jgi:hypothetical protein